MASAAVGYELAREQSDSTTLPCSGSDTALDDGHSTEPRNTSALKAKYPAGVPSKFTPTGQVQPYPGNSILCHLPASCPLLSGLHALHNALFGHPLRDIFAILPPSSWHMTIINEITAASPRRLGSWPEGMMDESLDVCTKTFDKRPRDLGTTLKALDLGPPYRLRVVKFQFLHIGIGIHITGITNAEESRL